MSAISDVNGHAVDLVAPVVEQVDFGAIAHALANINRYTGNGFHQCSVAQHLLIGLDLCPDALRPHWLLHDCHEHRLGDIARPIEKALAVIADEGRNGFGEVVLRAFAEFRRRHDVVIHAAAGLPMPSAAQRKAIEDIDRRCIATEVRDFHCPPQRPWRVIEGVEPARPLHRWLPPPRVSEQLLLRFQRYLPALRAAL